MSGNYQRVEETQPTTGPPTIVFDTPDDVIEDIPTGDHLPGARSRLLDAFGSDSEDDSDGDLDDWQDDRNITETDEEFNEQHHINMESARPRAAVPLTQYSLGSSRMGDSLRNFFGWRRGTQGGSSANNDGVFANIVAKPDANGKTTEDRPPTYAEAAADAAPPYWETTIMAPGISDELFIEGLPVGSPINFAWNFMVSSAFQFVGFFLTYLLHTSHAAKNGSRAGLGFTLLQCGWYLRPDSTLSEPTGGAPSQYEPNNPNDYDNTGHGASESMGMHMFSQGHMATPVPSVGENNSGSTGWISIALMIVGGIIMLKAISDYMQARRMEMAVLRSQSESGNEEADVVPVIVSTTEESPEEMV